MYVNMRLKELALCEAVGEPRYCMRSIDARINELKELLKWFGTEDQDDA